MDAAIKERWVNALRSGEYEQGTGRLACKGNENKIYYCCLGVLCEVLELSRVVATSTSYLYYSAGDGVPSTMSVPTTTARQIGLKQSEQRQLAILNDESGASFADIADYIEQEIA